MKDVSRLIRLGMEGQEPREIYDYFRQELDRALNETAGSLDENVGEDDLAGLALGLALRSYADKLACQRVLDLLQEKKGPAEKPKK